MIFYLICNVIFSAGAVDRLLCRIQGSEDHICCLRQVVNKIYSCISQSVSAEAAQQILSCLGGGSGGSASKINSYDEEIRAFQIALSKVRSMTSLIPSYYSLLVAGWCFMFDPVGGREGGWGVQGQPTRNSPPL